MSEEETAALKALLREIVTWLGQQQGRKGVWLAAADDFRERARPLLAAGCAHVWEQRQGSQYLSNSECRFCGSRSVFGEPK